MDKLRLDKSLDYIDDWLDYRYNQENIPGFSVAISYGGKLQLSKAYGYANLAKKTKLTNDHLFRVASHSKTLTATSLMQLAEQGKLRLDENIANHLIWLKGHKDPRWQNVTIRQLLCHGAGIIRDDNSTTYWDLTIPFLNEPELKDLVLKSDLVIDNNTSLKYSNIGYSLLGLLIEQVSQESYANYIDEHIIKPLGLTSTYSDYSASIKQRTVTPPTAEPTSSTLVNY